MENAGADACCGASLRTSEMHIEPQRTVVELKELRALTADEHGAQRIAWSDTWLQAREWFTAKLRDLPVEHHYDAAANHWITLRGASDKALILGSHLDSVPNGGWLDGCLGVLAALETLRAFAQARPPVTVRLVDWADEEGARFGRSRLCGLADPPAAPACGGGHHLHRPSLDAVAPSAPANQP